MYIVDLIASIRTLHENPDTFQEPSFKKVKIIPFEFKRVDIVADSFQTQTQLDNVTDSYQPNLIKISERHRSGLSSKIYIKSSKSRVPRNFGNFLLNGQKEQRMVEIIFSTFQAKKHILNYLKINQFIISKQNLSKSITLSAVRIVESP